MQKSFDKITKFIENILEGFASYAFIILFIIIIGNILCRFFLNSSLMWSIDISLFLYIIIIFIGTASAVASKDYMRVKLIVDRLPKSISRFFELIVYISTLLFGIVVLIGSIKMIPVTWNTIPSGVVLWLRTAYLYIVMLFAFFIISVIAFFQIIDHLKNFGLKK